MPVLVREVVHGIAEVRETSVEAITETVQANLLKLIRDAAKLGDTYVRVLEEQHDGG